jgi:hypothetical protein
MKRRVAGRPAITERGGGSGCTSFPRTRESRGLKEANMHVFQFSSSAFIGYDIRFNIYS